MQRCTISITEESVLVLFLTLRCGGRAPYLTFRQMGTELKRINRSILNNFSRSLPTDKILVVAPWEQHIHIRPTIPFHVYVRSNGLTTFWRILNHPTHNSWRWKNMIVIFPDLSQRHLVPQHVEKHGECHTSVTPLHGAAAARSMTGESCC